MADKRLFVYKNEAGSEGKVVILKHNETMSKFKKIASKKLDIKAKRVFLASGAEIQDVDELQNQDTLYISQGEPFYKIAAANSGGQETLNVSVLGSGGVGKSALTLRFVKDVFVRDWDPTIEDAYRKSIDVDGKVCTLEILDTAGQDDFESLRAQWMMDKDGYMFVYSMDSRTSLHELQPFFDLHVQINENRRRKPPIILVANKRDIIDANPGKRQISSEEGQRLAASYNARYVETSAKTGANVPEVFEAIVREHRRKQEPKQEKRGCIIL